MKTGGGQQLEAAFQGKDLPKAVAVPPELLAEARRQAATQLLELQADLLSTRLLRTVYHLSPFPKEYAFLFLFLMVILGVKLLTLSASYRMARYQKEIRTDG